VSKRGYNRIPTQLTENEFNEFVFPYLQNGKRGPRPKIALYKIFNYILYVIHTGCQWYKLPIDKTDDGKPEISYTRIFKHFRAWLRKGCFDLMFEASVALLAKNNLLDISIVHGDGTTTAAKKGGITLDSVDINTSKETKLLLFVTENAMLLRHLSRHQGTKMNHL
jgi:transposase